MIPNYFPGLHFVFEGIDGCGKSHQLTLAARFLEAELTKQKYATRSVNLPRVKMVKEPNKNQPSGKMICDDLAKKSGIHVRNPFGFQTWYAIDSRRNHGQVIIPHLQAGNIVLSDRSRPSMVYGAKTVEEIPGLMAMNLAILGEYFIWPDLIFIFDVEIKTALERLAKKGREFDGHEKENVLKRVRENYLNFALQYPNCHVINNEKKPEVIFEQVKKTMLQIIESKNQNP